MNTKRIFQVLSALILNFNCLCSAMLHGWPSSMMLLFKSDETPLNRPMTDMEISLFGSLSYAGSLVAGPFVGILLDKLGRKGITVMINCVLILTWAIIIFSSRVEIMLCATVLIGPCCSYFMVATIYVSEISEESIRGTLTSITSVCSGMGFLMSYSLKGLLRYSTTLYIGISMSILGMLLLMVLKESPVLLLKKGKYEEGTKAMAFYRNSQPNSKLVRDELIKIKRAMPLEQKAASEEMKVLESEDIGRKTIKYSTWSFFKKSRSSQYAFAFVFIFEILTICQGLLILLMYSKMVFKDTVPPEVLSLTWCSVLLSLVCVIFSLIGGYLADVIGRRPLTIYSCILGGVLCLVLGTQIHMSWGPDWLAVILIYMYCATYIVGSGTVPSILVAEVFLPDVRSVLAMLCFECYVVTNLINNITFNKLVSIIGLGPVFYTFSAVCLLTATFCFYFMPETKGLTVDAIQLHFAKPKNVMPE